MKLVHSLIAAALASSATMGQAGPDVRQRPHDPWGCTRRFRRRARQRRPVGLLLGHLLRPHPQRLVGVVGPRARRRDARLRGSRAPVHARREQAHGRDLEFSGSQDLCLSQRCAGVQRRGAAGCRAARRRVRSRGHRRASAFRNSDRLRRVRPVGLRVHAVGPVHSRVSRRRRV